MRIIAALLIVVLTGFQESPTSPAQVVVHEWGTFTTVSGGEGVSLDWRPLSGPSDLPGFVYQVGGQPRGLRHGIKCVDCGHHYCSCGGACKPNKDKQCDRCKECVTASVRMETPVLYFYSDRETVMSVKVGFPKGRITEWYPAAREVGTGIDWGGVKILPGTSPKFPVEKGESHYYPARETDANPIRICGRVTEHEKFLFYRGVGSFDLPIQVRGDKDQVVVKNTGHDAFSQVILFENRDGRCGYRIHGALKGEAVLSMPDLRHDLDGLKLELKKSLVAEGLYEREASAMLATWKDSWFEEGTRVFYIVPRGVTDEVLPLTLDPAPKELVRVLVGRCEILTPRMEAAITGLAERLGDPSLAVRTEAADGLRKYGRFAEPVLCRFLKSTDDAEVKRRIEEMLGR